MSGRTLAIVPALNERVSLPGVLGALKTIDDLDVLVVDDGSTDGTADVARAHGAMVARHPFNLGVGAALRTGFRFAQRRGYARAVQVDADGQHDVGGIAVLLRALDAGADLVVGSRFAEDIGYKPGFVRGHGMSVLRLALQVLSGQRFTDTSSGFRAFSRGLIENFASTYPAEYLSDTVEALLLACYGGFSVVEIPVQMHARTGGVPSTRNLRLGYHYVRVLLVLFARTSLRRRVASRALP